MTKSIVSCVALLGVVVACSGGGGSAGTSSGGSSSSDFAAQYCDLYAPCCAKANKTYNQGQCVALLTAVANGRPYDAARANECLTAARADAQDPAFCDVGISDATDEICEKVFEGSGGTKQPGEPCDSSADCASSPEGDVSCVTRIDGQTTTRTCRLEVDVNENDACDATRDGRILSYADAASEPPARVNVCDTAKGLYCDRNTKKCIRQLGPGGACGGLNDRVCNKETYCDTMTRQCTARVAAGGDCVTTTLSEQCVEAHYCDDTTKKCTPQIPSGQPCTKNDQCLVGQCTNGTCGSGGGLSTALFCQ